MYYRYIFRIDIIQIVTITHGQSGPEINVNQGVRHHPPRSQ